jgi:hypothetical protein
MSASSAETFARQVAGKASAEEKLDTLARAIVELAQSLQKIESEVHYIRTYTK